MYGEVSEEELEKIKKENSNYLDWFEEWLIEKGLSKKTIYKHVTNAGFYIDHYVCDYCENDVKEGWDCISSFLGDWFIRKAMWSSCANIKSTASSIKKFYKCMLEKGIIEKEDFDNLSETIKDEMPCWLDEMKKYENYDEDYF